MTSHLGVLVSRLPALPYTSRALGLLVDTAVLLLLTFVASSLRYGEYMLWKRRRYCRFTRKLREHVGRPREDQVGEKKSQQIRPPSYPQAPA